MTKFYKRILKIPFRPLILLLFVFPIISACGEVNLDEEAKPFIESAPDFTLEDMKGGQVSMGKLKGSPVFLNFWATWCRPCLEEMPDIVKISQTYEQKGLKVFAVNSQEDKKTVEKFLANQGIDIPVLLDKEGSVMKLYKVFGLPVSYFIHKDGKVAASIIGKMEYQDMDINVNKIL